MLFHNIHQNNQQIMHTFPTKFASLPLHQSLRHEFYSSFHNYLKLALLIQSVLHQNVINLLSIQLEQLNNKHLKPFQLVVRKFLQLHVHYFLKAELLYLLDFVNLLKLLLALILLLFLFSIFYF